MTEKLVAEEGLLKELSLSFSDGDTWVIGRDPDSCQLLVEDPAVSRKHGLCRKVSQGIVIENLSSTNPLTVNDEVISEPRLLQHGDLVKIGDTLFRYYAEAEAHLFEERIETNIPDTDKPNFPAPAPTNQEPEGEEPEHSIYEDHAPEGTDIAQVNFDMMETGRWLLKVVGGPNNGAEFSMQTGSNYIIGTDPNSCDIIFYDNSVSRQHARINISHDDRITIEDLKSRNGTRVDGELITNSQPLPFNTLVTIGTTSFVVYDREGEMQTIMSPLLPSIVKVLQQKEGKLTEEPAKVSQAAPEAPVEQKPVAPAPQKSNTMGALIITAVLIGIFSLIGLAIQSLLMSEPISLEQVVDTDKVLGETLAAFPEVKFSFNKSTGRLLLVGHVMTGSDKSQLMSSLQGLRFIKDVDGNGVIIDEYVWSEANQILSKNPSWKGVTVHAPTPGRFILSGYLQTRDQAQQVWDYLTRNFSTLDQIDNRIVVEEDVITNITNALREQGLTHVTPQMSNGEVILKGDVPGPKQEAFANLVTKIQEIPGIRSLRNQVTVQTASALVINISDRYLVSGLSRADNGRLSVVINGRILSEGDSLDGMTITSIQNNAVLLEKEGEKYRIDVNR
ncbi:MAG: type III secretion system inner membrane ring subunit SctD [Parachlamydiaceae bacterium]|nr:type III secretion system inner membrane ring subunit SctD [Parachlamydiaceae bacterium]